MIWCSIMACWDTVQVRPSSTQVTACGVHGGLRSPYACQNPEIRPRYTYMYLGVAAPDLCMMIHVNLSVREL